MNSKILEILGETILSITTIGFNRILEIRKNNQKIIEEMFWDGEKVDQIAKTINRSNKYVIRHIKRMKLIERQGD